MEHTDDCAPDLLTHYEWGLDAVGSRYKLTSYNDSTPAEVVIHAALNVAKGYEKVVQPFFDSILRHTDEV